MKKNLCSVIILFLFFIFSPSKSSADTIKIALGDALPPWVIPDSNSGILIEMLRECLKPAGYEIKNLYVPYARRIISYKSGDVDAVCDINQSIITNTGLIGYLSDIAYRYENIGVSLKENNFKFKHINDLKNVSITAWQGAKKTIGGEYARMAGKNSQYRELANQKLQIYLLYSGRTDLIQLDRQIFFYFRKIVRNEGKIKTDKPVDIFPIFGKNDCGFLFRDKKTRDTFNSNFRNFKKRGDYKKLFIKYNQ